MVKRNEFFNKNSNVSTTFSLKANYVVAVAQLVRALACGASGCGFKSRQSPMTY